MHVDRDRDRPVGAPEPADRDRQVVERSDTHPAELLGHGAGAEARRLHRLDRLGREPPLPVAVGRTVGEVGGVLFGQGHEAPARLGERFELEVHTRSLASPPQSVPARE